MNLGKNEPVRDARKFVSSVFDLAYGARDGSEPQSASEVRENLKEAGIDVEAAWSEARRILEQARGRIELAEARRRRIALPVAGMLVMEDETKDALITKIKQCIGLLGPGGAVYARKWENCSVSDLVAIHRLMERQIARSQEK